MSPGGHFGNSASSGISTVLLQARHNATSCCADGTISCLRVRRSPQPPFCKAQHLDHSFAMACAGPPHCPSRHAIATSHIACSTSTTSTTACLSALFRASRPGGPSPPVKNETPNWPSETGGRNGTSVAKFSTRRLSHICEMPPCRALLSGLQILGGGDQTGWLGWEDSNLRIQRRSGRANQAL
jgi:hypothetical protein